MPFALLSVSDKTGLENFARALLDRGYTLLSSGGTCQTLRSFDITVTDVSDYTSFPEIMGGRVKTLHPKIHGGILARRDQDAAVMAAQHIEAIDLVCVNLYPFQAVIQQSATTFAKAIENIDIGGPAMVRAAAKNHQWVSVVVDPNDYDEVLAGMDQSGAVSPEYRLQLAQKAFAHTASYDQSVAGYLQDNQQTDSELLPERFTLQATRLQTLRYGENSHQQASFYALTNQSLTGTLAGAKLVQGKPLSYNNIADADTAFRLAKELAQTGCVIVKHANPCGAARASTPLEAYEQAYRCDPTAAFGGIIAFNTQVDASTCHAILDRQFVEVLIAPAYSTAALELLTARPNLRVLATGEPTQVGASLSIATVDGGLLVQQTDLPAVLDQAGLSQASWHVVTIAQPSDRQYQGLKFAWTLAKYVKSNAIVFTRDEASIAIGAGQMSRVFAAQIAAQKADVEGLDLQDSCVASDGFFPFRDGVDTVVASGARAIIQPGGSKRDAEVIQAANEAGITMVFTGVRHFRH